MPQSTGILEQLEIASPCTESWEDMTGNDTVRFCNRCQLNVYHLSAMSQEEAVSLLQQREGKLCVRFYKRDDGTIMTQDCPVGLRALRAKAYKTVGLVASMVISIMATLGIPTASAQTPTKNVFTPVPIAGPEPVMGGIPHLKAPTKMDVPPPTENKETPLMGKPAINKGKQKFCTVKKQPKSLK